MRLTCVVGARPNFVKAASLLRAAASFDGLRIRLVHTGQHYDRAMSDVFFDELGLPAPDAWLGVGPGTHAVQTARLLESLDGDLAAHPADCVVVVGDVNSTMAGALVAAKRGVRVAHVEAGLRSRDRRMPEELNRIVTDQLADDLFTTEPSATTNLLAEGIAADRIHFVGNVMVDTLLQHRERARRRDILARLGCEPRAYAVCTLHRPANVDTPAAAVNTVRAVEAVAARLRVIFPLHPRTRSALAAAGVLARLESHPGMRLTDPLGYLDFLALMDRARLDRKSVV